MKDKKNKMIEFSKIIVKWLCIFWFIGGVYGMVLGVYAVTTEIATVDTVYNFLTIYIGAPILGTLIGYLAKAAFENGHKIKRGNPPGNGE